MSTTNERGITLQRAVKDPRPEMAELAIPTYTFPHRREFDVSEDQVTSKKDRHRQRMVRKNVNVAFVIHCAREAAYSARLYSSLKWYLLLLLIVCLELVLGRDSEALYWNTSNLGAKIALEEMLPESQADGPFWGKKFTDVGEEGEWYQWARQVVLPMFFDSDNPDRRTYENNIMLGNNLKVGAMRFRVINVDSNGCSLQSRWIPDDASLFPQMCYPAYSSSVYNKSALDDVTHYERCSNSLVRRIQGKSRTWSCSGVVHDIPFSFSYNLAKNDIDYLESIKFVETTKTRLAVFSAVTYNINLNSFAMAQAWVEISAGGTFLPQYRTTHFSLMRLQDKVMTIFILLVALTNLFEYISGLLDARVHKEAIRYVLSIWNIVSLINEVLLFTLLGVRFAYWDLSEATNFKFATQTSTAIYSDDLEYVAYLYDLGIIIFSWVVCLTFLTVLKYLSLNPNLNLLTRALARAQQDLIGLLVLFVTVLLAYSITANALFGSGLEEYRNLEVSFSSLMRMLLGDVDYYALRAENYILAGIFFWSYMLVAVFLLLNFIIAVIGNSFDQEKEGTKSLGLYDQISNFVAMLGTNVYRFFRNPFFYLREQRQQSKEKFAKGGKYMMIWEALREYRHSLPLEEIDIEDFALLMPDEQEHVMADPAISRLTLDEIFKAQADTEELGAQKLEYLNELFLDDFWFEAAQEFELHHEDEVSVRVRRRQGLMEKCAESQLRQVLGLTGAQAHGAVAQLFGPTNQTLDTLSELEVRINDMERTTDNVANMLCKLDSLVTLGVEGTAGVAASQSQQQQQEQQQKSPGGGGADSSSPSSATDRIPLIKPRKGLQPL